MCLLMWSHLTACGFAQKQTPDKDHVVSNYLGGVASTDGEEREQESKAPFSSSVSEEDLTQGNLGNCMGFSVL